MYACARVYAYVCVCVYVYIYVYMCVCVCVCILYMYICVYIFYHGLPCSMVFIITLFWSEFTSFSTNIEIVFISIDL